MDDEEDVENKPDLPSERRRVVDQWRDERHDRREPWQPEEAERRLADFRIYLQATRIPPG